jgi:hypothetical protein
MAGTLFTVSRLRLIEHVSPLSWNLHAVLPAFSPACVRPAARRLCQCAKKTSGDPLANDKPLESVSDKQGRRVSRYVDGALLAPVTA